LRKKKNEKDEGDRGKDILKFKSMNQVLDIGKRESFEASEEELVARGRVPPRVAERTQREKHHRCGEVQPEEVENSHRQVLALNTRKRRFLKKVEKK